MKLWDVICELAHDVLDLAEPEAPRYLPDRERLCVRQSAERQAERERERERECV